MAENSEKIFHETEEEIEKYNNEMEIQRLKAEKEGLLEKLKKFIEWLSTLSSKGYVGKKLDEVQNTIQNLEETQEVNAYYAQQNCEMLGKIVNIVETFEGNVEGLPVERFEQEAEKLEKELEEILETYNTVIENTKICDLSIIETLTKSGINPEYSNVLIKENGLEEPIIYICDETNENNPRTFKLELIRNADKQINEIKIKDVDFDETIDTEDMESIFYAKERANGDYSTERKEDFNSKLLRTIVYANKIENSAEIKRLENAISRKEKEIEKNETNKENTNYEEVTAKLKQLNTIDTSKLPYELKFDEETNEMKIRDKVTSELIVIKANNDHFSILLNENSRNIDDTNKFQKIGSILSTNGKTTLSLSVDRNSNVANLLTNEHMEQFFNATKINFELMYTFLEKEKLSVNNNITQEGLKRINEFYDVLQRNAGNGSDVICSGEKSGTFIKMFNKSDKSNTFILFDRNGNIDTVKYKNANEKGSPNVAIKKEEGSLLYGNTNYATINEVYNQSRFIEYYSSVISPAIDEYYKHEYSSNPERSNPQPVLHNNGDWINEEPPENNSYNGNYFGEYNNVNDDYSPIQQNEYQQATEGQPLIYIPNENEYIPEENRVPYIPEEFRNNSPTSPIPAENEYAYNEPPREENNNEILNAVISNHLYEIGVNPETSVIFSNDKTLVMYDYENQIYFNSKFQTFDFEQASEKIALGNFYEVVENQKLGLTIDDTPQERIFKTISTMNKNLINEENEKEENPHENSSPKAPQKVKNTTEHEM